MHLQFQKQTNFVKLLHENFLQLIFLYLFYKISRKDTKKKQIQRDPICTKLQQKICINQDNVQWLHEQKIQNQALHSPLPVRYFYQKKKKKSYQQPKYFHKHLHIIFKGYHFFSSQVAQLSPQGQYISIRERKLSIQLVCYIVMQNKRSHKYTQVFATCTPPLSFHFIWKSLII